ncbi:MAG: hypothetical protein U0W24_25045 [Bacteroidales bacterium]
MRKKLFFIIVLIVVAKSINAQFLMDMIDTSKTMGIRMFNMYSRFDNLFIGGYIQPQYQVAEVAGAASFNGGNFDSLSNNRFMIRRGRMRFDYQRKSKEDLPSVHIVFQFDFTDKGAFVRDFWGRIYDTRFNLLSVTAGIFARPFGYEINLGSSDRESPERGRITQILMKSERDLGLMLSFYPQLKSNKLYYLKFDLGVFNGQGLAALSKFPQVPTTEYDSRKDIIGHIAFKPYPLKKNVLLSGGASFLYGGLAGANKTIYVGDSDSTGNFIFRADSSINWTGKIRPRQYFGADMQLKFQHKWGATEFRAEYFTGIQTSTSKSTETPSTISNTPLYSRNFNGGIFYFLQNIVNNKHQLGIKYDWYDPNTSVKGIEIRPNAGLSPADIKYNTLGFGYIWYFDPNIKLVLWYEMVNNELTDLDGFNKELRDNIFTIRLQFRI